MENGWSFVGSLAVGSVTVQGTDGSGTASRWINNGDTYIGLDGIGTLAITDGGNVRSVGTVVVGSEPGSIGTVNVSGPNSLWDASAGPGPLPTFQIGVYGTGILTVSAGGEVRSEQALLGAAPGGLGQVTVSGAGSSWTPSTTSTWGSRDRAPSRYWTAARSQPSRPVAVPPRFMSDTVQAPMAASLYRAPPATYRG